MSGRFFAEASVDQRMVLVVERVGHQMIAVFGELLHCVVGGDRVVLSGHQSGGVLLLLQLSLVRIGGLMIVRQLSERMRRLGGLEVMRMVRGDCVMILEADVLRVLAAGDVLQARMQAGVHLLL